MDKKITSREFLGKLHGLTKPRISFSQYIYEIRRLIALENDYITSSVDYDEIIMDMVDFGYLKQDSLLMIEFKGDK